MGPAIPTAPLGDSKNKRGRGGAAAPKGTMTLSHIYVYKGKGGRMYACIPACTYTHKISPVRENCPKAKKGKKREIVA